MANEIIPYDKLQARLDHYEKALQAIFKAEGKVCQFFHTDGCAHPACRSSNFAWAIAYEALYPPQISSNLNESVQP